MKSIKLILLAATVAIGLGHAAASASTPMDTVFTYQGRLKENGSPPSADFDFKFTLWDAGAGGNKIDDDNPAVRTITVTNGLFTTPIDFDDPAAWNGDKRWLQIRVSPAGANTYIRLRPRQKVTAAPTSHYSLAPWTTEANGIAYMDGDVGIGTSSPIYALDVVTDSGTAIHGLSTALNGSGVWGEATDADAIGVRGSHFSPDGIEPAILGETWSEDPGGAAAVKGTALGQGPYATYGVLGFSRASQDAVGVRGECCSSDEEGGDGCTGQGRLTCIGVEGEGELYGVHGVANNPADGEGVFGQGRIGVHGDGVAMGVYGESPGGTGVLGESVTGTGVHGKAISGTGVRAEGKAKGVHATADALAGTGVRGEGNLYGLEGVGLGSGPGGVGAGIKGVSQSDGSYGVWAVSNGQVASEPALFANGIAGLAIRAEGSPAIETLGNIDVDGNAIISGNVFVSGFTVTSVLTVTGADLAEKFPMSEHAAPGMVVAIDPQNPGQLCLSRGAYNRCVAGVVSGANGLSPGTILGNLPGYEDAPPIALTGRVWVHCDAGSRGVVPGDLMTTAERPGYAMAAGEGATAGAIVGKAMTGLEMGQTGLVLVLVNLQ